jgi:hypothetical protein
VIGRIIALLRMIRYFCLKSAGFFRQGVVKYISQAPGRALLEGFR